MRLYILLQKYISFYTHHLQTSISINWCPLCWTLAINSNSPVHPVGPLLLTNSLSCRKKNLSKWISKLYCHCFSVSQLCLTLCDPMDCSTSGFPVLHQLLNSCLLSRWCHPTISSSVVPFSSCLQSSPATGSFLMDWFFTLGGQSISLKNPKWLSSEVAQLCPTLCDPMDFSLPSSSVCGIFQAKILEWVAISFYRRSS